MGHTKRNYLPLCQLFPLPQKMIGIHSALVMPSTSSKRHTAPARKFPKILATIQWPGQHSKDNLTTIKSSSGTCCFRALQHQQRQHVPPHRLHMDDDMAYRRKRHSHNCTQRPSSLKKTLRLPRKSWIPRAARWSKHTPSFFGVSYKKTAFGAINRRLHVHQIFHVPSKLIVMMNPHDIWNAFHMRICCLGIPFFGILQQIWILSNCPLKTYFRNNCSLTIRALSNFSLTICTPSIYSLSIHRFNIFCLRWYSLSTHSSSSSNTLCLVCLAPKLPSRKAIVPYWFYQNYLIPFFIIWGIIKINRNWM